MEDTIMNVNVNEDMKIEIDRNDSIGVFDSGVGGLTTLKELVRLLPHENFIFYGDSLNAPYGDKTPDEIIKLADSVVRHLLAQNVKAIVIACNTATSVAVDKLRSKYSNISIIGMEPALKMAVDEKKKNRVLVMATPVTLRLEKFNNLKNKLNARADFITLECPLLAKRIEKGNLEDKDLKQMLEGLLEPYKGKVDVIVLGCTHYPFVKKQILEVMGNVKIVDGAKGTSKQLERVLSEKGLLNGQVSNGSITFQSSKDENEELDLYRSLYEMYQ